MMTMRRKGASSEGPVRSQKKFDAHAKVHHVAEALRRKDKDLILACFLAPLREDKVRSDESGAIDEKPRTGHNRDCPRQLGAR